MASTGITVDQSQNCAKETTFAILSSKQLVLRPVPLALLRPHCMTLLSHWQFRIVTVLLFEFVIRCVPASGQTFEFLPEVDAYYKIQPNIRFTFQAKETREAGDPTQAEIGPGLDFFVKPLVQLKNISSFDPDEAKSRLLQVSVSYRYLPSPDKPTVERLESTFTSNVPLVYKLLLSDRNRVDLDWSQNPFTWRYRNRVKLQRTFSIRSYHLTPYVSGEAFYLSQYQKWTTTALYAGCLLPLGKHVGLDPYYEHQNVTSKSPNQQLNQFGLILNVYF